METLHHFPRQFTLGVKTDGFRNPGLFTARAVFHPMARQVEFTIQQRVAQRADVGQKHPHLTIFDLFGAPTILLGHSRRLVSTLGKTRLIEGHNGMWVSQSFQDILSQFVTNPIFIPHRTAQEALHPVRPRFSCLFSQLPAIFACHVTENALQIQERTLAGLRTSKKGSNAGVQMT